MFQLRRSGSAGIQFTIPLRLTKRVQRIEEKLDVETCLVPSIQLYNSQPTMILKAMECTEPTLHFYELLQQRIQLPYLYFDDIVDLNIHLPDKIKNYRQQKKIRTVVTTRKFVRLVSSWFDVLRIYMFRRFTDLFNRKCR